jgi:glycosyltransferase involved in cell wall biosynthesis
VRILWMSNSPMVGTGYGVQTAEVVPRIAQAGHQVAIANNFGHHGPTIEWNDIPIFSAAKDQALNDVIRAHAQTWKADWVISLYDTWTMRRQMWPDRVASWVPVDHQPAPPEVAEWCRTVTPIAMSRFGQKMLRDQGIDSSYVPHSINTEVFQPTPLTKQGMKPRQLIGIPDDAFVVMIAAANQGVSPPRKAWGEMFDSLGFFMREHDDVWLYVHTDSNQTPPSGVDLLNLRDICGIPPERVKWSDAYAYASHRISLEDLALLYSMSDVLLASSMGEGFGIPVVEAQACGLPVIVSDFTAQPELCASGWLVKGQPFRDVLQHGAAFFTPYINSIVARLTEAREQKGNQEFREQAVKFAADYDTDKVFAKYWLPVLAELEAQLDQPAAVPVTSLSRAERRAADRAAKKRKVA